MVERHYVTSALELANDNRTVAAELLGLSRQSLYAKLNRYGLDGGSEKDRRRKVKTTTRGNSGVVSRTLTTPAFGQADLSNCEREQIQLAGSIQPHGALLVVREPDFVVVQASANTADFLGLSGNIIGRTTRRSRRRSRQAYSAGSERVACGQFRSPSAAAHLSQRSNLMSCSIARRTADLSSSSSAVRRRSTCPRRSARPLQTIISASTLRMLCEETATHLQGPHRLRPRHGLPLRRGRPWRGLLGAARASSRGLSRQSLSRLRHPADRPPTVRAQSRPRPGRRRLRSGADPAPAEPLTDRDLDMSLCFLRSMSPIHIQYLKNMGVGATLVASLMVGGKLWGLVACHHYSPRSMSFRDARRLRIAGRSHRHAHRRARKLRPGAGGALGPPARAAHDRGDLPRRRLADRAVRQFAIAAATVVAPAAPRCCSKARSCRRAKCPAPCSCARSRHGSTRMERVPVFSTASLGFDEPDFAPLVSVASGIVATPVSSTPGEYLIWFRPERIRTRHLGRRSAQAGAGRRRPVTICRHAARSRNGTSWSRASASRGTRPT